MVLKVRVRASISLVMTSPGKDDWQFDGSANRVEAGYDESDLLRTFLEHTPDHVYFKDAEGRFTKLSASLARWIGLDDADSALGRTDSDFFAETHAAPARAAELEVMRTGEPVVGLEECEVWPDGRVSWVSTTKVALRASDGHVIGIFGLSRDITARKLTEQRAEEQAVALERLAAKLEQLTLHDELTGLHNRRGLELHGDRAIARAGRDGSAICVLFMDLDGLKAINDQFGHAAGDQALIAVAGILRDSVRLGDVTARIGGDEFTAVLVGVSPAQADDVCARVRRALKKRGPSDHTVSVSIGLATLAPGQTLPDLIETADRAMYDGRSQRRRSSRSRPADVRSYAT